MIDFRNGSEESIKKRLREMTRDLEEAGLAEKDAEELASLTVENMINEAGREGENKIEERRGR